MKHQVQISKTEEQLQFLKAYYVQRDHKCLTANLWTRTSAVRRGRTTWSQIPRPETDVENISLQSSLPESPTQRQRAKPLLLKEKRVCKTA